MTALLGANVKGSGASGTAINLVTTQVVLPAQGALLFIRSYPGSSGVASQPATPAGFQYIGGVANSNSSFIVREDVYWQRGAGSTITAAIAGTTSVVRHAILQRVDAIDRDDAVTLVTPVPYTSNRTDASVQVPASAYPNALAVAALALGGTAGGSGVVWNAGTAIEVGSATASHSVQAMEKLTAGVQTLSATWTTAGTASIVGILVGGDSATPLAAPSVTLVSKTDPTTVGGSDGKAVISWPAVTNAVSYRVEVAPGANATAGFVVRSETATSPYTVTNLSDGTYTIGVTAKP